MRSVMTHQFSRVPTANIPRSRFDRSHGLKTTFDAGWLIPIYADEVYPGDTVSVRMTGFGRLATPIYPLMDNLRISTFFFEVPNRQLWANWQRFHGEQNNPGDSTDYTVPVVSSGGGFEEGSIFDYMGVPPGIPNIEVNRLFFNAYNHVWNEWFRDENFQDKAALPITDGSVGAGNFPLLKRGKRHDYFTSSLPWPQKGESVQLPLGNTADIAGDMDLGQAVGVWSTDDSNYRRLLSNNDQEPVTLDDVLGPMPEANKLYADLSTATAATINQLRQAFQVQKLLERDARGGTRYTEIIKAHFNVDSPDLRLQRPGYLGGGISYININPVAQTSQTDSQGPGTPQGNLAAFGTVGFQGHGFTRSFTEHSIIIGLACVTADLTYQQGIDRKFSRLTRYDYYYPALAQIGEQAVLNKEIYAQGTEEDDDVFGYQERFAELRYKNSLICGRFRSTSSLSLDAWHLSQEFADLPTLSDTFIEENPPVDRVIATQDEPHIILDAYFKETWARPMPLYGVPGLIDHF